MITKDELVDIIYDVIKDRKYISERNNLNENNNGNKINTIKTGDIVKQKFINSFSKLSEKNRQLVTEYEIKILYHKYGTNIKLNKSVIISPLAKDFILEKNIKIKFEN